MTDVALYIHIPFCRKKCRYCDFTSFSDLTLKDKYIDSLLKELILYSENNYRIKTIYMGGGTPSLLSIEDVGKIVNTVYSSFRCDVEEFTLECNPESLDEDKFKAYKELGVNRLSIGIQSFNDDVLRKIGRIHDSAQAETAIESALKYFDNVSVDLIAGLPDEKEEDLTQSISRLIEYGIPHISVYTLIVEESTPICQDIKAKRLSLPNEEELMDRFDTAAGLLKDAGYQRYEISNFAKDGFICQHNMAYWALKDYIGAGLAAHGCLNRLRTENTNDLNQYIQMLSEGIKPYKECILISREESRFEYIMLSFRLQKGIDLERYRKLFNEDFLDSYSEVLSELENCLIITPFAVVVRPEFFNIINQIILKFMD